jgi:hypothetical protein
MAFYRIYQIGADDHIRVAQSFDCASGEDALAKSREQMEGFPRVEVWIGTQCIARLTGETALHSRDWSSDHV